MEVICLQTEAFYTLIDEVVNRIKDKQNVTQVKWVTSDIAMQRLGITSKTTLQSYRDEGRIRFSQPDRKVILYDVESINQYLEKHAHETF